MRLSCKGFTLIELLVVIAIICILIAALLPLAQPAKQRTNVTDVENRQPVSVTGAPGTDD